LWILEQQRCALQTALQTRRKSHELRPAARLGGDLPARASGTTVIQLVEQMCDAVRNGFAFCDVVDPAKLKPNSE
jgi:hypothetical protein